MSKTLQYIETVGRRKTAVARVRLSKASKNSFVINGKALEQYFPVSELQKAALAPLLEVVPEEKYSVSVVVKGGGTSSQSGAISHGLGRALAKLDPALRGPAKKGGFLKRDARAKERRKFGLKKARKAPQWAKR